MKPQKKLIDDLPTWIPHEEWDDWLEMRRKKKKPLTENARERAIQRLWKLREEGQTLELVLNQSTDNGWPGLFKVSRTYFEGFVG